MNLVIRVGNWWNKRWIPQLTFAISQVSGDSSVNGHHASCKWVYRSPYVNYRCNKYTDMLPDIILYKALVEFICCCSVHQNVCNITNYKSFTHKLFLYLRYWFRWAKTNCSFKALVQLHVGGGPQYHIISADIHSHNRIGFITSLLCTPLRHELFTRIPFMNGDFVTHLYVQILWKILD